MTGQALLSFAARSGPSPIGPLDWLHVAEALGFPVALTVETGSARLVACWSMRVDDQAAPWGAAYVYAAVRRVEWRGKVRYHVELQSELADGERTQFNRVSQYDDLSDAAEEAAAFVTTATRLVVLSLFGFVVLTPATKRFDALETAWDASDELRAALAAEADDERGCPDWLPCRWDGRRYLSSQLDRKWREFVRRYCDEHDWRGFA
jgi:hypothetical protein